MEQEVQWLLSIVKCLLNGEIKSLPFPTEDIDWRRLFVFAERHGILNFIYYGLEYMPKEVMPDEKLYEHLRMQAMQEIAKCYNQLEAAEELIETCEKERVCILTIKGVCTKFYYPAPDMRTMGDVDILYQSSQHEKIRNIMRRLEYDKPKEGRKHDYYFRKPFVSMEMHRELVASDSQYSKYYEDIWERLQLRENYKYIYGMSKEDEYIYTFIHLVEHFQNGGIGIRFVMDIYVYNQVENMNWDYIETELKKLKLLEFFMHVSRLAEQWFGVKQEYTEEEEEILKSLASYILANGICGSKKNAAAISVVKNGKAHFLWKAIFPDLKNMQSMFPWLKKWPALLPYSWLLRGIRSVMFRRGHIKTQIARYKYGDKKYGEELKNFYERCGLK